MYQDADSFFKSNDCRFKRIRKVVKGKPNKEYYDVKVEQLALLEKRAELGEIDILYGDETQISEEGYVPYGWQFSDENVCIESAKGAHINCFGLLSRDNSFRTPDFIIYKLFFSQK